MEASSETYIGKAARNELDLELGRILLRIHCKWQQSGQHEDVRAESALPLEEMETVIIPADSETVPEASPDTDELMETVILSPLAGGENTIDAALPLEEVPETVITKSDKIREMLQTDELSTFEEETVVLVRDGANPGQSMPADEECLDETVVLPPSMGRLRRRGMRKRYE